MKEQENLGLSLSSLSLVHFCHHDTHHGVFKDCRSHGGECTPLANIPYHEARTSFR